MNIIGNKLFRYDKINSTNILAAEYCEKNSHPHGTVFSTKQQISGHGQGSKIWNSEKNKNIQLSVILEPDFVLSEDQFLISQLSALSVKDFISDILEENECKNKIVKIKWPNDIYVENDKIAGILIEHSVFSDKIAHSIIGIGINVNQLNFPNHIPNPISLSQLAKRKFDVEQLELVLLEKLQKWWNILEKGDFEIIKNTYLEYLYRINLKSNFREIETNKAFKAIIQGVNSYGQLILTDSKNSKRIYCLQEIELLKLT